MIGIDALRAVAAVAVILLHVTATIALQYGQVAMDVWWINHILNSISRFSVPVFFMISGALLLDKQEPSLVFYKKRILRIFPLFLLWSLIYIVFDTYVVEKQVFTLYDFGLLLKTKLWEGAKYHLWFIYTLIGIYFWMPLMRKWINKVSFNAIKGTLFLGFICLFLDAIGIKCPPFFRRYFFFLGYIWYTLLGYYLFQKTILKPIHAFLLFLLGTIITVIGTFYLNQKGLVNTGRLYTNLKPNIVLSAIGIFLFFKVNGGGRGRLNPYLTFICKQSYGIYLAHILVLSFLNKIQINGLFIHPLIGIPLTTFLCVSISSLLAYLIDFMLKWGIKRTVKAL